MTEAEAAEVARAFPGVPLLFNWAEGGKTPPIGLDRLAELGYRIVIFPISTLLAATAAMRRILREIATAGTPAAAMHRAADVRRVHRFHRTAPGTRGRAALRREGLDRGRMGGTDGSDV